ncbi:MAG: hypothetical protein PHN31_03445 [Candidatus Gracilibacteria bacterium]|nr:hypothetical protein [Candidatus Gracilibacteria bacterium]
MIRNKETYTNPEQNKKGDGEIITSTIKSKTKKILDFQGKKITFERINIDEFIENIHIFRNYFKQNYITKDDINNIVGLIKQIHKFIMIKTDEILSLPKGKLNSLKDDYMRIHEELEKIKEKNPELAYIDDVIKEFREHNYYLFVPPKRKELPIVISPQNTIKAIINDGDLISDEEKFTPILIEIKEFCGKIITGKEIIEKLDSWQLNQLIGSFDYILEEIEIEINKNNHINQLQKNKIGVAKFLLQKARKKLIFEVEKKELPKKIKNLKIEVIKYKSKSLAKNNVEFSEFLHKFRTIKQSIKNYPGILKTLDKKNIELLIDIISIIIKLFNEIIKRNISNTQIILNSKNNILYIHDIINENEELWSLKYESDLYE